MPERYWLDEDEIVVDNFAGGGGASTGIEEAIGRPCDYAVNHSPEAIAVHNRGRPRRGSPSRRPADCSAIRWTAHRRPQNYQRKTRHHEARRVRDR